MLEWVTTGIGAAVVAIGSGLVRGSQVQSQHAVKIRSLEARMKATADKTDENHDGVTVLREQLLSIRAQLEENKRVLEKVAETQQQCLLLIRNGGKA